MLWHPRCRSPARLSLPPTPRHGPQKNATCSRPRLVSHARWFLVECPKRGDGQDWDGSHLLELLPECDILIAAPNCQGYWPRHPAHGARTRGWIHRVPRHFAFEHFHIVHELAARMATRTAPETAMIATILTRLSFAIESVDDT